MMDNLLEEYNLNPKLHNDYDAILRECLVVTTSDLHTYNTLSEATKTNIGSKLVNSLINFNLKRYDNAKFKVTDVTKGDITRLDGYKDLVGSINFLKNLQNRYGKNVPEIMASDECLRGLEANKGLFTSAYSRNDKIMMMMYNSVASALIVNVSLFISNSIEYIKDNRGNIDVEFKDYVKKNGRNTVFDTIKTFNNITKSGKLRLLYKNSANLTEDAMPLLEGDYEQSGHMGGDLYSTGYNVFKGVMNGAKRLSDRVGGSIEGNFSVLRGNKVYDNDSKSFKDGKSTTKQKLSALLALSPLLIAIIIIVMIMVKQCIYLFQSSRADVAENLRHLADFVEMNASVENNDMVRKKKEAYVVKLRKWADKLAKDIHVAENEAQRSKSNDDKGGSTNDQESDSF